MDGCVHCDNCIVFVNLGLSFPLSTLLCIPFNVRAEDSSSTPPAAQLLPGAASINADTPSAVILPQTIDQLPADDSPASEPPPLPPKSSYWNTSATDASAVMEDARPQYFKIQPSPKPASLDLKQAVSISTKQVYYNVVPEVRIYACVGLRNGVECVQVNGWSKYV